MKGYYGNTRKKTLIWFIIQQIDSFDWSKAFENVDVDNLVEVFNETILKIIRNFIPNKVITVGDREAKWMNNCQNWN